MRPLSTIAGTRAAAQHQAPVFLLRLWTDAATWHFSTAPITYDSAMYIPALSQNVHWRESLADSPLPGGYAAATASLEILSTDATVATLRTTLATAPPQSIQAELRLGWLDLANPATALTAAADAMPLLRGAIAAFDSTPRGLTVHISDSISLLATRPLGRLLRSAMLRRPPLSVAWSPRCRGWWAVM